jgi:hypothetical protein
VLRGLGGADLLSCASRASSRAIPRLAGSAGPARLQGASADRHPIALRPIGQLWSAAIDAHAGVGARRW